MKWMTFLYMMFAFLIMTGCQGDKPKPEAQLNVQEMNSIVEMDIPVSGLLASQSDPFYVNHYVKGKSVFIECMVQGITFREVNHANKGKIIVHVNGKKKEEVSSAAFIVKGLTSGTHRIKLEVVKDGDSSIMMKKEFYVTIP